MPQQNESTELPLSKEQNSASDQINTLTSSNKNFSGRRFAGGILAPLGIRNFRLLFGGQTISTLGDAFYAVALPWLVLTTSGSTQELGIVLTTYGIPRVGCILLGGMLSDRLRPRRVMLLTDAVRAVLVGILAALALWGHPNMWQLIAVAVPLGAFEGIFLPATSSMLPEVLDDADLQAGNALNMSSMQLANLLGSGIAGIVVSTLQSGVALALDALSFVISAISLAAMRGRKQTAIANATETVQPVETLNAVAEGVTGSVTIPETEGPEKAPVTTLDMTFWRLLQTSSVIQVALVVVVVANLTFGGMLEVALPALARGTFAAGAGGFGLMLSAFGAGALIGGLGTGMLGSIPHRGLLALLAGLFQAFTVAFIPYGGLAGATVCMFAMGVSNSFTNVIFLTILQQISPRHLLGRTMALIFLASFGTYPLSVAAAGFLVARFGPTFLFPVSGAALFLAIGFGLLRPELREL